MRTVSKKRARENRERRKLLGPLLEHGALCEVRLHGCTSRAVDGHEIKTRGRGGSIVDLNNIALVCRSCHDHLTANSGQEGWAIRHGWVVASWADTEHENEAWVIRHTHRCPISCTLDHRKDIA